jgi:hypothetical protein
MNQTVQKQTSFFGPVDLDKISLKTEIALWEIEHATGIFINRCTHKTIPEAYSAYEASKLGSRERFEIKLRLDDLCFRAIEESNDFYHILSIFKFTAHESRSYKRALEKMLDLGDDEKKLKCLIEKCPDIISKIRTASVKKIVELNMNCV